MKTKTRKMKRISRGQKLLLAAPVAMGAMSGVAAGNIVYTSVNAGTGVSITDPSKLYFDVDGRSWGATYQAGDDFELSFETNNAAKPYLAGIGGGKAVGYHTPANYISKLSYGTTINGSGTFEPEGFLAFHTGGQWVPPASGYAGLQLGSGDFGWANLTVTGDGTNDVVTLYGFAYDNTGAAINAGTVPEPGEAGLLGAVAAGSVAAWAARKRRLTARARDAIKTP